MEYAFLDRGDDELVKTSELSCDNGIALAVRSTSFDAENGEVVELAIVDLTGAELFCQRVKPQNVEDWAAGDASGGIGPADVAEAPELFQFEDEIIELFEKADVVVAAHISFVEEMVESSWVSLPAFEGADIVSMFCATHCAADYSGEPAATASLSEIASYYKLGTSGGTALGEAALAAACYRAIIAEHASEREAKGAAYWTRYDQEKAGERAELEKQEEFRRKREKRLNQMNGLLWLAGAIIFTSLAIQLSQRGSDMGVLIISGAIAVFALIRAIANFRK